MISKSKLWQTYAAFASGFGCFSLGLLSVWSSYTSPLYSSNSTTLLTAPMTKLEDSLLGSVPSLGSMLGTTIAASILDKFGRRNGGILLSLPYVISWVIIGISSSINVILAARFLSGVSGGGALVFAPILVSEVSDNSIRGFLASVSMLQYSTGMLISYITGWCFSYRVNIWINIVCSVSCIGFLMFMEESPTYLIRKQRYKEAKVAIARYRGVNISSMEEMDDLLKINQLNTLAAGASSKYDTKNGEIEKNNYHDLHPDNYPIIISLKMLILSVSSRRAFLVVITLMTLMVFTGLFPVQVYANVIFSETDPSRSNAYTVIFAAVQVAAAFATAILTDKFGRRLLQIGSSVLVSLCVFGLGYILQYEVAALEITVVLIMLYSFFFTVGLGSIPYVLIAEVFAPEVINLASFLIIEWMWLLSFVVIAIFPYITDIVGICGAFYGFGIVSVANAIFSYLVLPETAGLSNEQIQEAFLRRRKK